MPCRLSQQIGKPRRLAAFVAGGGQQNADVERGRSIVAIEGEDVPILADIFHRQRPRPVAGVRLKAPVQMGEQQGERPGSLRPLGRSCDGVSQVALPFG